MAKQTYYVKGMHCASCEVLIEEKTREIDGVNSANASTAENKLEIDYKKEKPTIDQLNKTFKGNGFEFFEKPTKDTRNLINLLESVLIATLAIGVFLASSKLGLASFININSQSSLISFFVLGLIAGVSGCAALVGGLVLSLAKQWSDTFGNGSTAERSIPHLMFNCGRIASFAILGGMLGLLGAQIKISPVASSIIILAVSATMLVLAMKMLGIPWLNRLRISLPKGLSGKIINGKRPGNRFTPFIVGFITFLLPCGFTLAAEGMAVLSGSALKGSMIMIAFVLGTTIPLLVIGLSSAKLIANPKTSDIFLKVAGILIIFFVLYNINFQFGITRYLNSDKPTSESKAMGVTQDIQVIKAIYTNNNDIQPNQFTVKVGKPVRFEVDAKDDGFGCMGAIMITELWTSPKPLKKGQTIVMEFTPQKAGMYQITCAMGVPRGSITVTD